MVSIFLFFIPHLPRIIFLTDTFSYEKVSYNNSFNLGYPIAAPAKAPG